MIAKIKKHKHNIAGIMGMMILQSNQLPLIYQSIQGQAVNLFNPLLVITGLSFYLYYAVSRRDLLYIVSNSIGICLSSILILTNINW